MKQALVFFLFIGFTSISNAEHKSSTIVFNENKGQVVDQNNKVRNDILLYGKAGDLGFFVKKNGISYQLYKMTDTAKQHPTYTIQRVDINWLGVNRNATVLPEKQSNYLYNYYYADITALKVKCYEQFSIRNLYKAIDLKYYQNNGSLKYDYIVQPFADYRKIQMKFEGATLSLEKDGTISIKTPLGTITEEHPVAFQDGKQIEVSWQLTNNVICFNIPHYDHSKPIVIDPLLRVWGTYYGGTSSDFFQHTIADSFGNIYLSGQTQSINNIATSGAFQTTYGGSYDVFMSKFNSSGHRIWSTYYGGSGGEDDGFLTLKKNRLFFSGATSSTNFPITTNVFQNYNAGGADGFISKFDTSGIRIWATYFGGIADDVLGQCELDENGYFYIAGGSASTASITTSGVYQPTYGGGTRDAILAKFDTFGHKIWCTYFGGNDYDGANVYLGRDNRLYLYGLTLSTNGISSAGAFQPNFSGGSPNEDAFIAKFDTSGQKLWSTYYGYASSFDVAVKCLFNDSGQVYLFGYSYQSGFIVQFDTNGNYYFDKRYPLGLTDALLLPNNHVLICGGAFSATGIATPGTYQPTLTGSASGTNSDAGILELDAKGNRLWGTYYGGMGINDNFSSCSFDGSNNLYFAGCTNSTSNIADVNAYQGVYGGGNCDGMVIRFSYCTTPKPNVEGNDTAFCFGSSLTLTTPFINNCTFLWTKNTSLLVGNLNSITVAQSGKYTVTTVLNGCPSVSSDTITITVLPNHLDTISISSSLSSVLVGQQVTINAAVTGTNGNPYQINWYKNGVLFTTTTTPTVNYTKDTGTDIIHATLIVQAQCYDSSASNSWSINSVGIGNIPSQPQFLIFPNPATNTLYIQSQQTGSLVLADLTGRVLLQASTTLNYQKAIDISMLAKGVYLLRFSSNDGAVETVKVVKE